MAGKSIFKKQMALYLGILIFSFTILGGAFSVIFSRYYINQKETELIEQGKKIAEQYSKAFYTGVININQLSYELQILEEYMDASVFYMNRNGEVDIASSSINQSWIGQTITDDAIKGVLDSKIVTVQGKINGMFMDTVLTVGYPITVEGKAIGGIFMCVGMPEIKKSMSEMYAAAFFCVAIAVTVGSILVYFSSKKISNPLLEMNKAAKIIAEGNFENRITITSDDEVGQLAESFNNMAASLYEHEQQSRAFIANISHDLRSPLTSIQGFLSAILDGTVPEEKVAYYLGIVLEETERLSKLTNDIVDLSKAQSSVIDLLIEEFDINQLIRDCVEKLYPRFIKKNISLNVIFENQETNVAADAEKILRVFQNLIDNAIKFTPNNGNIEIETTINKNENKVYVCVRDSGVGISAEDCKHIFERFYKADASRGVDKRGGGLGLAIAKEFISAHNERIFVKSNIGIGSEFIFTLALSDENNYIV